MNSNSLEYYRHHSPFTDPGAYAACFDDFPNDLPGIVRAIQGLIIPPYAYTLTPHGLEPDDIEDAGFGIRRMEDFIAKLLAIHQAPLTEKRPPRQRLGVNCRNFAVLLVSVLRHQGVPARERVGFEGYLGGGLNYEHRIAEYWNAEQGRWLRVDAFVDRLLKRARTIAIDTLDIRVDEAFRTAGEVWLAARRGEVDANTFGDSPQDIGMPPIRYALLHDFDALNRFELLGDDTWGDPIEKLEADLTPAELRLLDKIARLTSDADARFASLTALHTRSNYGKQVRAAASALGL